MHLNGYSSLFYSLLYLIAFEVMCFKYMIANSSCAKFHELSIWNGHDKNIFTKMRRQCSFIFTFAQQLLLTLPMLPR